MKKQKKYEIISETDKVVTFKYDGAELSLIHISEPTRH